MTEREAIGRFVADGDSVYVGYTAAAYGLIREVVRQKKTGLEMIGASVGPQGSLLIMGGCADRVRTGYLAAALRPGLVQDMMSDGTFKYEDYSNQAIALMLMAGALGIPFIPTRSFLGTDYLDPKNVDHPGAYLREQKWRAMESPFDGQPYVALPALRPDVALLHAQRADEFGNVQIWGHQGDARWAYWAAKKVIVSVEEIVPHETVLNDPGRTVVPGLRVSAIVHMPYGAHPAGQIGYYDYDYAFQGASGMSQIVRSEELWHAHADEWIYGVEDHAGYLRRYAERFGEVALAAIAVDSGRTPDAAGVRYGYAKQLRFRMES
jgi:glutaconate CoA-transferase subunit A